MSFIGILNTAAVAIYKGFLCEEATVFGAVVKEDYVGFVQHSTP